jgi:hypothetical protein
MNCGWHNVGINCNPVVAPAVYDLEKAVITPGPLIHLRNLRIQVFIPVVALKGSKARCVKEVPGDDPCRSWEKQGTDS